LRARGSHEREKGDSGSNPGEEVRLALGAKLHCATCHADSKNDATGKAMR